jgi:hypothetical protein
LIYYPFVRFCLEFFRTDSRFFPGTPFNVVHLLSAIAIVTAITLLIVRHHSRPAAAAVQGEHPTLPVECTETREVENVGKSNGSIDPAKLKEEELEQEEVEEHTPETGDSANKVPGANGLERENDMEAASLQADGLQDLCS